VTGQERLAALAENSRDSPENTHHQIGLDKMTTNNSTTQPETTTAPILTDEFGFLTADGLALQIVAELKQLASDKGSKKRRDDKTEKTFTDSHEAFEKLLKQAAGKKLKPITQLYTSLLGYYADKDKKEQIKALDLLKKRTIRFCSENETAQILRVKTTGSKVVVSWQEPDQRKVLADTLKKAVAAFCKDSADNIDLNAAIKALATHDKQTKADTMSAEVRDRLDTATRDQIAAEQKNALLLAEIEELKGKIAA